LKNKAKKPQNFLNQKKISKINNFEEEILQIESQIAPIGSKLSNFKI